MLTVAIEALEMKLGNLAAQEDEKKPGLGRVKLLLILTERKFNPTSVNFVVDIKAREQA